MVKTGINKKNLIIGSAFVLIGIVICLSKYLGYIYLDTKNNYDIECFFENTNVNKNINIIVDDRKNIKNANLQNDYMAILEIPSISLKRGLVDKNNKNNTVSKNIQILETSDMPDVENGVLYLASHSGSSYVSFFKNLYKLSVNEKVYIYYQGYKYEYIIDNIYDTLKDGNIEIYRDHKKTAIALITCKKNAKDTQIVYIGYLVSKEQY